MPENSHENSVLKCSIRYSVAANCEGNSLKVRATVVGEKIECRKNKAKPSNVWVTLQLFSEEFLEGNARAREPGGIPSEGSSFRRKVIYIPSGEKSKEDSFRREVCGKVVDGKGR